MKDLVNAPTQKYDNMYNIIGNSQSSSLQSFTSSSTSDTSSFLPSASLSSSDTSSFLPSALSSSASPDSSSFLMKNELKQFLKTQLKR
jgi:hypothetical protein